MKSPLGESTKRRQVSSHLAQFLVVQLHVRHQITGLDCLWMADPGEHSPEVVRDHSRGERPPAHQMREVGPEGPMRRCAPYGVAIDAGHSQKSGARLRGRLV